jgi:uncharacterized membrane protein
MAEPEESNPPPAHISMSKGRMDAYSDGVFSIAATLLVLDITVHPPGSPLHQVLAAWPQYLAYVVSFLTIGAAWLVHSALTDRLERADALFVRLNLVLLMVVAFLPFPTRLLADALDNVDGERVAVTIYGPTLLVMHLLVVALVAYAKREHLFKPKGEGDELLHDARSVIPVTSGYLVAILIGLVLPGAAVALYCAVAVYLVVPFGEIHKLLSHARRSAAKSAEGEAGSA